MVIWQFGNGLEISGTQHNQLLAVKRHSINVHLALEAQP